MTSTTLHGRPGGQPDMPGPAGQPGDATGTDAAGSDVLIARWRSRIDEIDANLIRLWQERAAISRQVGAARVASGGTRLVLSREREILDRFAAELGEDGTQLALLLLRAGRGRL